MYQDDTSYVSPCKKCSRHIRPIKTVEIDSKTKKKWLITQCPHCDYKFDLEPYYAKAPRKKNISPTDNGEDRDSGNPFDE